LNKGLVKKSIVSAILNFLNSIPFQKRFDGFPIQLKGVSEGFRVPDKILTFQMQILYLGD